MPRSVYTSPEFMKLEIEKIFAREWLCAGRASALAHPGDYLTMEIAGYPIIILRDRDGGPAGAVERLPAPDVDAARGPGQHPRHQLPLPRLDLQPRRQHARRAGHDVERGLLQGRLPPAAVPLRGVAGLDHGDGQPDAPPVAEQLSELEADRRTTAWSTTSSRSARPSSGTPTGRCWPRTSWKATTSRSATTAPSGRRSRSTRSRSCRARPPTTTIARSRARSSISRSRTRTTRA
jgi:hypothetical protein